MFLRECVFLTCSREGTCYYLFILISWIYSVVKRILEEVGFICEGFRFRVVSKTVISTLTVLHLFPLVVDLFLVALVPRYELSTHSHAAFQGAAVASLENTMFTWNLSGASYLNLDLLPESVTSVLVLEFVNLCEFHLCLKSVEFYFVKAKKLNSGMLDAFAMIMFWRPVKEMLFH